MNRRERRRANDATDSLERERERKRERERRTGVVRSLSPLLGRRSSRGGTPGDFDGSSLDLSRETRDRRFLTIGSMMIPLVARRPLPPSSVLPHRPLPLPLGRRTRCTSARSTTSARCSTTRSRYSSCGWTRPAGCAWTRRRTTRSVARRCCPSNPVANAAARLVRRNRRERRRTRRSVEPSRTRRACTEIAEATPHFRATRARAPSPAPPQTMASRAIASHDRGDTAARVASTSYP